MIKANLEPPMSSETLNDADGRQILVSKANGDIVIALYFAQRQLFHCFIGQSTAVSANCRNCGISRDKSTALAGLD